LKTLEQGIVQFSRESRALAHSLFQAKFQDASRYGPAKECGEYFMQRYANRAGRNIRSIDKKTLDLLQSYDWPGNIRELQNVLERSIILSSTDVFSVDELWLSQRTSPQASRVETSSASNVEPRSEREIIEAALAETRGRVSGPSGAAAKLRIPPSTLETRIKALKINKQQFKFG
jgi:DNA-binding NtrC family response regulator